MKIAVNGFGRIGRLVTRIAFQRGLDVVAVNDVHGAEDAAYLLKYDSTYGLFGKKVRDKGNELIVGGKKVRVLQERDPLKLPWKELGVDVVVEATGVFTKNREGEKHLKAGAKYVLVTAPAEKVDATIVCGVNDDKLEKKHKLISIASCTTNCLAPMLKILNEDFGIEKGFMTTVHAYTSSQGLVDESARNPERGRAGALNIIPTTTGAMTAVFCVLPEMKGKLEGMALRVPVPVGSITDLTVELKKKVSVKSVNDLFRKASKRKMKGIVEYNDKHLVSSDIVGNPHSCIFNPEETKVNGNMVKVLAWYDNEWGYSNRVVDVVEMLEKV
ncbi:MAG: type I glyceraldehyde-3-phosphate dehydrogenase [archaeon]